MFIPFNIKRSVILMSGIIILVISFAAIVNTKNDGQNANGYCQPYSGYFIWDISESDNSVQRHYISRIINNAPVGSNIILKAEDNHVKNFEIQNSKTVDEIINVLINISTSNMVSYVPLEIDIAKSLKHSEKEALILFLFVNKNTSVDTEKIVYNEIKKHKVFVVYKGPEPIPFLWTYLATDEHHLLHLKDNIEEEFLTFQNVICHDSTLYCDNDLYWNGVECSTCFSFCTKMATKYCNKECPYFVGSRRDKVKSASYCVCESNNTYILLFNVFETVLLCILIFKMLWDYRQRKATEKKTSDLKEIKVEGNNVVTTDEENMSLMNGKSEEHRNGVHTNGTTNRKRNRNNTKGYRKHVSI